MWGQVWHPAPSPGPLVSVPVLGAPHSPGHAALWLCSVGAAPSSHFISSPTAACAKVSGGAAAGRGPSLGALSPLPDLIWMGSSSPPAGVEKSPGAKAGGCPCVRTRVWGEGGRGDMRGASRGTRSTRVTSSGTRCKQGMLQGWLCLGWGLQKQGAGWQCPACVLNPKHPEMGPQPWLPAPRRHPAATHCASARRPLLPPSPFCPLPAPIGSQLLVPPLCRPYPHTLAVLIPGTPPGAAMISALRTRQALPRRDLAKVQAAVQACVEAGVAAWMHK